MELLMSGVLILKINKISLVLIFNNCLIMKSIKFLLLFAALTVCGNVSAQFSNTRTTSRQSISSSFDGNGPSVGYKGFVDLGYTFGVGDFGEDRIAFSTTHGYQINPYVFAGIGAGINYYTSPDAWSLPIFADVRGTFLNNSITPFIDLKIGYSILDAEGFYLAPSIGCRINRFNVSIGYELQKADLDFYYFESKETIGGISLKIGLDF